MSGMQRTTAPRRLAAVLPLSPRQAEIRGTIFRLHSENGRSPSLSEVARALGISSHGYVGRVWAKLQQLGEVVVAPAPTLPKPSLASAVRAALREMGSADEPGSYYTLLADEASDAELEMLGEMISHG